MNKKALLIAVVAALAGIALSHLYLTQREAEISGGSRIPVLIAARDLRPGTVLHDAVLGVRSIPQAYVGERNISARDSKKVVGIRVSTYVKANEPVLWSDIASLSQPGHNLSASVQDGKRALALSSSASTFSGLLRPGDRVDILFTPGTGNETSTLLQNILVLAVGSEMEQLENTSRLSRSLSRRKAVTVSVTMEESQLLTQAERQGHLKLVLRNPEDIELMEGVGKTSKTDIVEQARAAQKRGYRPRPRTPETEQRKIERVR